MLSHARTPTALMMAALLAACGVSSSGADGHAGATDSVRQPTEDLIGKSFGTTQGMNMGFREFDEVAARRGAMAKALDEDTRRDIVDGLIDEKLLYLEAVRQGADLDPKIQRMVVNTYLKDSVYESVREQAVTPEEMRAFYDENIDEFASAEKRKIHRILVKPRDGEDQAAARARADVVRASLEGEGVSAWGALAAKHSDGPYKSRNGDLGFLTKGKRPGVDPAVIEKAFALPGAGLSDVFETVEGFTIIHVPQIRPRREPPFDQVKGSVARKVKAERYKASYEAEVKRLRANSSHEVNWQAVADHVVEGARPLRRPTGRKRAPAPDAGMAPSMSAKPEAAGHDHSKH